ncbi:MAG: hypothetical protein D4S01_10415 [Dehalococcoidia bacterium]|nr:MAG: hypothetical protein D4S01_10415 [Dehalococcoidia bacterium]
MEDIRLQEATLNEICEELGNRSLSYVFVGKSYSGSDEDDLPILAIGVRTADIAETIGVVDIAKAQLIDEFRIVSSMINENDE